MTMMASVKEEGEPFEYMRRMGVLPSMSEYVKSWTLPFELIETSSLQEADLVVVAERLVSELDADKSKGYFRILFTPRTFQPVNRVVAHKGIRAAVVKPANSELLDETSAHAEKGLVMAGLLKVYKDDLPSALMFLLRHAKGLITNASIDRIPFCMNSGFVKQLNAVDNEIDRAWLTMITPLVEELGAVAIPFHEFDDRELLLRVFERT